MNPVYTLFLGRKAFVPARPIFLPDGLRGGQELRSALLAYPPVASGAPLRRRMMLEHPQGEMTVNDQPISFAARRFAMRRVHLEYQNVYEEAACTSLS